MAKLKARLANLLWSVLANALSTWLGGGVFFSGVGIMLSWFHALSPIWFEVDPQIQTTG
jgi:hypothetical protein